MGSRQELQGLLDALQQQTEQVRFLTGSVKRALATKKDHELKQQDEALFRQLEIFSGNMDMLQEKVCIVKNNIRPDSLESEPEDKQEKHKSAPDKRSMNPEDQENMYQLKATMMPQIYSQNRALQGELTLYHKRNELRNLRKERQVNYNRETNLSVATILHILNKHDKRAKEAERRAEALQTELEEKNGQGNTSGTKKAHIQSSPHKIEDVMKKNQILIEEGDDQRREIQRLKKENADLMLRVKHSAQDRDRVMTQLSTSEMARKDLYSRFQRQKSQHDRLSKSLTRQSTDWIESRKVRDQEEEDLRWRQVGHAGVYSGQTRTFSHPVPRNVDQPRNMFPATHYDQPQLAN